MAIKTFGIALLLGAVAPLQAQYLSSNSTTEVQQSSETKTLSFQRGPTVRTDVHVQPIPTQVSQKPAIQQVQRQDLYDFRTGEKDTASYLIQLDPPGPERLFRLESEQSLMNRMRQDARANKKYQRIEFPPDPVLSTKPYQPRSFKPMQAVVEPNYVCYGRLYFHQKNFDRYGWDVGPLTPIVCAGQFYWDAFFLPYHMGTEPFRRYECNSGYCLPGDPVPLLIYPPKLSVTGVAAQGAALTGGFFIFP